MGTPRACYICNKPTTTVLATINTVDFVYTCDSHLTDTGFASRVGDSATPPPAKPDVSADEIAKVKEEYEERQKRKQKKDKEKDKEKGDEKDAKGKGKDDSKDKKDAKKATSPPASTPSPAPTVTTGIHQRYTLHRDIFALRLAEHRRRRQSAQAQALAPRLPGAPRSPLPSAPPTDP